MAAQQAAYGLTAPYLLMRHAVIFTSGIFQTAAAASDSITAPCSTTNFIKLPQKPSAKCCLQLEPETFAKLIIVI
ncbi:hypothetical protein [Neisseria animalis]|uniref:Uncharacterized protein n=1 Tax=Neisseria animalis TaxID=492 RepID=A0A5P3MR84_NEIAN|nr:hypothetical protein [Neisseria animalis]QEY23585.1 hypothetical protein D0T90_02945 [Neisseria animalis]ROW32730.1 hypothetical protein CGZ60_02565 [Neisseria animalis]VEE09272.1 Uncharacterised protein [Neisseria animalis]